MFLQLLTEQVCGLQSDPGRYGPCHVIVHMPQSYPKILILLKKPPQPGLGVQGKILPVLKIVVEPNERSQVFAPNSSGRPPASPSPDLLGSDFRRRSRTTGHPLRTGLRPPGRSQWAFLRPPGTHSPTAHDRAVEEIRGPIRSGPPPGPSRGSSAAVSGNAPMRDRTRRRSAPCPPAGYGTARTSAAPPPAPSRLRAPCGPCCPDCSIRGNRRTTSVPTRIPFRRPSMSAGIPPARPSPRASSPPATTEPRPSRRLRRGPHCRPSPC